MCEARDPPRAYPGGPEGEGNVAVPWRRLLSQCEARADGSFIVRLTLPPGASVGFSENDVLMLSKDNLDVSTQLSY
jgi:hypothetical protein